ncbi:hypothetical protein D3C77_332320 [compost metagenome]
MGCFTYLRTGLSSIEQRKIELQANGTLLDIPTIATTTQLAIAIAKGIIVADLVAHHGIQGRRKPGLVRTHRLLCYFQGMLISQYCQVLLHRRLYPSPGVIGYRQRHRHIVPHPLDHDIALVGQGIKGFECIVQLFFSNNPIGPGGVMAGLGLQDIGAIG